VSWVAALSALVAVAAALHAWQSARRLRAAARQTGGGAHGPALSVAILDADIRLDTPAGAGQYALLLAVTNGTPLPRVFTSIDLRIRCRTPSNFTGVVTVPLSAGPDPGGSRTGEITLRLPLTVEAEQVLIGWAHFTSGDVVQRDGRVDGYGVVLIGDAGEQLSAEAGAVIVRQGINATVPA
jgi:hypothetical protein